MTLQSPFKSVGVDQIRKDMSMSPRGVSPTESRVEFLLKAKEQRHLRNEKRRNNSQFGTMVTPKTSRDGVSNSNMSKYGHSRRMTLNIDQSYSLAPSALSTRRQTQGPVMVPRDMTPQNIAKSKNESIFTRSLLTGGQSGYAHV